MRLTRNRIILALCVAVGGPASAQHGGHIMAPAPEPAQPSKIFSTDTAGLPQTVAPAEVALEDGDTYILEAKPAKQNIGNQWIRRLAYNGSIPGPIFRVKQGSSVVVKLKNSTETATTLHPHGLRIESKFDGVPGIGQDPIKPGQSYDYRLNFPDAGIYWYHPHIREDYAQEAGLYGIFIVEPENPEIYNQVHREIPLVLDDVLLDPKQPFQTGKVTHTLMGRFGNVNMVNGLVNPTLTVTKGEIIRFFVLNTSNTRVFALAIPGIRMKLVGGDNGLYENEQWSDKVILAPGERGIIEAQFATTGKFAIRNNKPKNPVDIAQIEVKEGSLDPIEANFDQLHANEAAKANLETIRQQLQKVADKKLKLTLTMDHSKLPMDHSSMGMGSMEGMDHSSMGMGSMDDMGIEWDDEMPAMNKASDTTNVVWKFVDEQTRKENMDIDWTLTKGQYTRISIFNDPNSMHPMQHPIHFHGQRFVIASINGKVQPNLVWKDTALIPAGARVDLILEVSNPGAWMAHCHISEHMEANMMFHFKVAP